VSAGLGGTVTSVPGVLGFVVVVSLVDVEVGRCVTGEVVGLMLAALSISPALHFVFSAQSQ
jgi:hypothetical protein